MQTSTGMTDYNTAVRNATRRLTESGLQFVDYASGVRYYTPSEEGFRVFDIELGRIGIIVCFDRHYPETIRTQALKGADLIIIPTANTKSEPSEMFIWEIKVQAYQNSVKIAMCNRVGVEGEMEFSGESVVVDHNGNTFLLDDDSEGIFMADTSFLDTAQVRLGKPYTSLRRKELYE